MGTLDPQLQNTPPPPYDNTSSLRQLHDVFGDSDTSPVTTLLGSSVVATAQVLGYELPSTDSTKDVQNEEALQQKSGLSADEWEDLLQYTSQVRIRLQIHIHTIIAVGGGTCIEEHFI